MGWRLLRDADDAGARGTVIASCPPVASPHEAAVLKIVISANGCTFSQPRTPYRAPGFLGLKITRSDRHKSR
jgi:hypothetical protein